MNIYAENESVLKPGQERTYRMWFLVAVLAVQQLLGAFAFPIAKFGLTMLEPFTFAFYRFLFSSIVLLLVVRLALSLIHI